MSSRSMAGRRARSTSSNEPRKAVDGGRWRHPTRYVLQGLTWIRTTCHHLQATVPNRPTEGPAAESCRSPDRTRAADAVGEWPRRRRRCPRPADDALLHLVGALVEVLGDVWRPRGRLWAEGSVA